MGVMKKLSLIVAHTDIVSVISELITLECVEPIEPEITLDPPELTDLVGREIMELDVYEANKESITLLTTQYTYTLIGWVPEEFEPELTMFLSRYTCSWSLEDPHPYNYDEIPVIVKYPQVFGKFRSGGRRVFEPLAKRQLI
jgi:vacuolar-type H+-ATPase subunit I/STV1